MFLITSLLATSLNFFRPVETVFNFSSSKSFTFVFKLIKSVGTLTSLLISSLSTRAFKATKFLLAANLVDQRT